MALRVLRARSTQQHILNVQNREFRFVAPPNGQTRIGALAPKVRRNLRSKEFAAM
jgi:hypothetical protein